MRNFIQEVDYILTKALELKQKYTDDYQFDLDYLNIFSENTEDYESLIEQGMQKGKIFKERNKGIMFELNTNIAKEDNIVKYVQIAKPNRGRGVKGYLSYTLKNFDDLKEEFDKGQNIILVEKQDYLRLEVKDSSYDVMVYIASDSLIDSILHPDEPQEAVDVPRSDEDSAAAPEEDVDEEKIKETNSSFGIEAQLIEEKGKRMQLMADFQNYQKRIEAEKATWGAITNMALIQEMLEVHDDIELAMQDDNLNLEGAKQSMKTAQDKLLAGVERAGIERVDVKVGDNFDKEKMEAVSMVPVKDDSQKNKVIAVISSAYKFKNKEGVLKAAKVVVGK